MTRDQSVPLSPKHARFVQEYLIDLNATQAAIRSGYSAKTADVQGPRLLGNVRIKAAVEKALNRRKKRRGITKRRVLRELRALAFSNHTHFKQDDVTGQLVLVDGAPKSAHAAVASVKYKVFYGAEGQVSGRECEFRLWPKPGPLELAGKHVGLFGEKKPAEAPPTEIHIHGNIQAPVQAQPSPVGPGTTTT